MISLSACHPIFLRPALRFFSNNTNIRISVRISCMAHICNNCINNSSDFLNWCRCYCKIIQNLLHFYNMRRYWNNPVILSKTNLVLFKHKISDTDACSRNTNNVSTITGLVFISWKSSIVKTFSKDPKSKQYHCNFLWHFFQNGGAEYFSVWVSAF